MDKIARDIFRAIHTGVWLRIEYVNQKEETTRYWIGIKKLNPKRRTLTVDGLNVATQQMTELTVSLDGIRQTDRIEGTYYEVNEALVRDIAEHPARYASIFESTANLKILDYYMDCNRLDVPPERVTWSLIEELDIETLGRGDYHLSPDQYALIIQTYNLRKASRRAQETGYMISLCMNLCSLPMKEGLCVLAYREVLLDVVSRTLRISPDVTICSEFTVEGKRYHIDRFLSEEHRYLLEDYAANEETIKDIITRDNPEFGGVDDMPYLMAIARHFVTGLDKEYAAILEMMHRPEPPLPLRAFFGTLQQKPRKMKNYPLALYNEQVNVDQLNALHSAMKYPLLYVQGPPGTGKTNTILNLVTTAFFHRRTVLISSYNNHPMDEIYQKLQGMVCGDTPIPFPVIRLGNNERVKESIEKIRAMYAQALAIPTDGAQLEALRPALSDTRRQMQRLGTLLKRYERRQEEEERKDMLQTAISSSSNLMFLADLQGRQLKQVNRRIRNAQAVSEEEIREITQADRRALMELILQESALRMRRIEKPKFRELYQIIFGEHESADRGALALNEYLSHEENLRGFLQIFPVVITTNSSAGKLGRPAQYFDMTIIDEASQCAASTALLPVLRGKQLLLVGDPQQLKPVVQLDPASNAKLRRKYQIPKEYDYIHHSAYETFLAVDAVSDEVLLRYHYRCHPQIIQFNNRKYYQSRLQIRSSAEAEEPLLFLDCRGAQLRKKNTSDAEALAVLDYIKAHPEEQIGIITPFVNQRDLLRQLLKDQNIHGVSLGTVHAFQGDERQVILFTLALTARTGPGTYGWLKNNRELINVATSRAREKLVLVGDARQIRRLHGECLGMGASASSGAETTGQDAGESAQRDDIFELFEYVCSNGRSEISETRPSSRALGIKPYEQKTEDLLLSNLNHALQALPLSRSRCRVETGLAACDVLTEVMKDASAMSDADYRQAHEGFSRRQIRNVVQDIFYRKYFDYVVYEEDGGDSRPIFAIELTGLSSEENMHEGERRAHLMELLSFQCIEVPGSYARRYQYLKEILTDYFRSGR